MDLRVNPYQSPVSDEGTREPVGLTLGQSVWKYAKLGAATAFIAMTSLTILITLAMVILGLAMGLRNWELPIAFVGSSVGLIALMSLLCAIAGALIGMLIFALRRWASPNLHPALPTRNEEANG